jgi:hypothetical protein
VFVLGGDRFAATFNRGAQRVPGEAGAFDAGGELAHASEDFQEAQMVLFGFGVEAAFDHPVEFVDHHFGLLFRLAFDCRDWQVRNLKS